MLYFDTDNTRIILASEESAKEAIRIIFEKGTAEDKLKVCEQLHTTAMNVLLNRRIKRMLNELFGK